MAITKHLLRIEIGADILDIVTAVQNDSASRFLDVELTDGGLPVNLAGHTVRFSAVKPDGRRVFNNAVLTDAAHGRFQVELTDQVLARTGKVECQFTVFNGGQTQTLSTNIFCVVVTKSLIDYDALESTNEYGAAVILFQYAEEMRLRTMAMDDLLTRFLDMKLSGVNNGMLNGFDSLEEYLDANLKAKLDMKLSAVNAGLLSVIDGVDRYVKSKLDTMLEDITEKISESSDLNVINEIAALNTKLDEMQTEVALIKTDGVPVIKSIQRGSFIIDTNTQTDVKVTINTVNISKCQIDVWGQGYSVGGLVCSVTPSLSSDYIDINLVGYFSNGLNGARGTWQVIEYV